MKHLTLLCGLLLALPLFATTDTTYTLEVQMRPRAEWRDGYNRVNQPGDRGQLFLQQRSRIGLTASFPRWEVKVGLQEVRSNTEFSPGASAPALLGTYEAWGAWKPTDRTRLIVGRQVVKFDDERVIGGLDWAQTGRFLDAARLNHRSPIGATSVVYAWDLAENMTRTMVHHAWEGSGHRLAGLAYERAIYTPGEGVTLRELTLGLNWKYRASEQWAFGGEADAQTHSDRTLSEDGLGSLLSVEAHFTDGGKGRTTAGAVRLNGGTARFDASLGTNHAHYGWMDHFYVGAATNGVAQLRLGHVRPFGPARWKAVFGVIYHRFYSDDFAGLYGDEIDAHLTFRPSPQLRFDLGQSVLFSTPELAESQGSFQSDDRALMKWSWLSLSFFPKWNL
jgi:hypothetical protein